MFPQTRELEQIVSLAKAIARIKYWTESALLFWRHKRFYMSQPGLKERRTSLGKPIVSIEVERRSLVNLYRISMQEGSD